MTILYKKFIEEYMAEIVKYITETENPSAQLVEYIRVIREVMGEMLEIAEHQQQQIDQIIETLNGLATNNPTLFVFKDEQKLKEFNADMVVPNDDD